MPQAKKGGRGDKGDKGGKVSYRDAAVGMGTSRQAGRTEARDSVLCSSPTPAPALAQPLALALDSHQKNIIIITSDNEKGTIIQGLDILKAALPYN